MKKVILSVALLTASAFSVLAQSNKAVVNNSQSSSQQELVEKSKVGHAVVRGGLDRAFEGLELSDEQKTKLNAIAFTALPSRDLKKAKDMKKDGDAKKDGDKKEKMTPEQMKQLREERMSKQLEARKVYLMQVKEILTPDQYIMFLENSYTLQDDGGKAPMMNRFNNMGIEKKMDGKRGPHRMKDPRGNKGEQE